MNPSLSASVLIALAVAFPAPPTAGAAAAQLLDPIVAGELVEGVSRDVATLRGLEFRRPVSVAVVDDDEARRHMLTRLDRLGARERLALTSRAYVALGLVPAGADLLELTLDALREQAGGFYDPAGDTYYLLDDIDEALAGSITAHELTHALEDQHFDLDARIAGAFDDDDRLFAISAVHEGSAMVVMTAWIALAMREGRLDVEGLQQASAAETERAGLLDRLPEVARRQLLGPYVLGSLLVSGGPEGEFGRVPEERLRRLYDDPPGSSEQVLHPERYWDEARRDDPLRVRLPDLGAALGPDWRRRGEGVLGELTLAALLGSELPGGAGAMMAPAASWTLPAATGWGGDAWELWSDGERDVVALLTVWDDAAEAAEFAAAAAARPHLTARRRGDRVAVLAAVDAAPRAARILKRLLRGGRVEGTAAPR